MLSEPGSRGRGFVTPEGRVYTWPEDWGSHMQRAQSENIPFNDVAGTSFITRGDGTTFFPYTQNDMRMQQQLGQEINGADPRLNWVPYKDGEGPAQMYADPVQDEYQSWRDRPEHGSVLGKTADQASWDLRRQLPDHDPNYYYHMAPAGDRARIQTHGLQAADPTIPEGVYLWEKPGQAINYMEQFEHRRKIPMDIWRIPGDPDVYKDPDTPMGLWMRGPAMDPELYEGPEHRVWNSGGRAYEEQWNNRKPLNLNMDTNPDYEQLWNQRVGE